MAIKIVDLPMKLFKIFCRCTGNLHLNSSWTDGDVTGWTVMAPVRAQYLAPEIMLINRQKDFWGAAESCFGALVGSAICRGRGHCPLTYIKIFRIILLALSRGENVHCFRSDFPDPCLEGIFLGKIGCFGTQHHYVLRLAWRMKVACCFKDVAT